MCGHYFVPRELPRPAGRKLADARRLANRAKPHPRRNSVEYGVTQLVDGRLSRFQWRFARPGPQPVDRQ